MKTKEILVVDDELAYAVARNSFDEGYQVHLQKMRSKLVNFAK
jgi:hypothetical protein